MRKRYKKKKRCCGLCKPHKRGWSKKTEGKKLLIFKEHEAIWVQAGSDD